MKRDRKFPRRRYACKRALPRPQAGDILDWSELDCSPLTPEVLDLAMGLVRVNNGVCGIILTGAGDPKAIYPSLSAPNEDLGKTLEDERS